MPTKAPNKLITATINGKQVQVPEGTLVIEAARLNGFDVPNFCYEPSLRPWGSCRMCMVEVHGRRPYLTEGCSLPLRDGMRSRPTRPGRCRPARI
jgi:NADH dehydrogenase/NADH:ubiquinone oxidoreductase subunit G